MDRRIPQMSHSPVEVIDLTADGLYGNERAIHGSKFGSKRSLRPQRKGRDRISPRRRQRKGIRSKVGPTGRMVPDPDEEIVGVEDMPEFLVEGEKITERLRVGSKYHGEHGQENDERPRSRSRLKTRLGSKYGFEQRDMLAAQIATVENDDLKEETRQDTAEMEHPPKVALTENRLGPGESTETDNIFEPELEKAAPDSKEGASCLSFFWWLLFFDPVSNYDDAENQDTWADAQIDSILTESAPEASANIEGGAPGFFKPVIRGDDGDTDLADEEDESAVSSKLFRDLNSLVSKGDSTIVGSGANDLNTADLDNDGRDDRQLFQHDTVADIVEKKVKQINVPEAMPCMDQNDQAGQVCADMTIEARRQLLVKELRSTISNFGRYDVRCANVSAALGDLLEESEEHSQAIKLHKEAIMIYSAKLGDGDSTTMNAKMRLGNILESAEEYDEAINTYYLVTLMRRALNGEKDPSAADGLVCMAHALRKKGEYEQAIKELKRSLKMYRESLGDDHEKVSSTVDEIASLYVTIGDFEKSAAILEEVVKLKAATLGLKSRAVAETLVTLATTYECSGRLHKSMKSLKKAYKIYTETEGYSSEDASTTLNKIAQLYEAIGDFNRASIAYLGVLRGRKINLGDENLQVGETYFKLGHALRQTGQLDKALKCMKESLPIFVGKGVEMHDVEMIAEVMHEMALINKEKNHFEESARILKQELSVRRKIGQPEFPLVARTLNHLGMVEFQMRNNNKALKYLVEALTIYQECGEQGIDCAEVLHNTGLVFEVVQNNDRALEAFTEAARILKNHGYGKEHPQLEKVNNKICQHLQSR